MKAYCYYVCFRHARESSSKSSLQANIVWRRVVHQPLLSPKAARVLVALPAYSLPPRSGAARSCTPSPSLRALPHSKPDKEKS